MTGDETLELRRLDRTALVIGLFVVLACALAGPSPSGAGDLVVDGKLGSSAPTGSPLAVASSEVAVHLNVDRVDGFDAASFARSLGNVVTVATSGGDFDDLGEALSSITDASQTNPYLVTVGPGTFHCGPCTVRPHVHVLGSGPRASVLSSTSSTALTAVGPGPSSVRRLGFAAESSGSVSAAIGVSDDAFLRADEVLISVVGGSLRTTGIQVGSGALGLHLFRAGIDVQGPKAANGIRLDGGTGRLNDVRIRVTRPAVGDVLSSNVGVSIGSEAELEAAQLEVVVSGGGEHDYGVETFGSLLLRDSIVDVEGFPGGNVTGVRVGGGSAELARMTIDVDGGEGGDVGGAEGVVVAGAATTLRDCVVRAAGSEDAALYVNGSGVARVHHSRLSAPGLVVSVVSGGAAHVVHSHLEGATTDSDTICRFTTDEHFVTYGSACP